MILRKSDLRRWLFSTLDRVFVTCSAAMYQFTCQRLRPSPAYAYSRKSFQFLVVLSLLIVSSACSRRYDDLPAYWPFAFKDYPNRSVGRFKTAYLVDQIDNYYRGTAPGPIGVTTFVNVDDLYTTSTFGRMVAEQVMSELTMKGYDVVELRHSDALQFLNPAGEFALSRDIASVRRQRDLGGVVVGTYTVSPVRVYLNARLLDPSSSMVLSAGSVEMSKSYEITRMLRGGAVPATMERIPVRHLGLSTYPMNGMPEYVSRAYDNEDAPRKASVPDSFAVEPHIPELPKGAEGKKPKS